MNIDSYVSYYVGDPTKLCCEMIFSAGFAAEEQLECLFTQRIIFSA